MRLGTSGLFWEDYRVHRGGFYLPIFQREVSLWVKVESEERPVDGSILRIQVQYPLAEVGELNQQVSCLLASHVLQAGYHLAEVFKHYQVWDRFHLQNDL